MTAAPLLTGNTVCLRHHVLGDMDAFWAFYQTPRAVLMDVPKNRTHLWYGFASEVASWELMGMGAWAIEVDGKFAGQVAITQPPHFPEPEIGWLLFDGFEGRGIAFEAAQLALDYARQHIRLASLVSYVHRANERSAKLAQRLGATPDPDAPKHDAEDIVYRHPGFEVRS